MFRFHLILGVLLFVVFLFTGVLMFAHFPDKEAIGPDLRLLLRSRHIYILFSATVHLLLGVLGRNREGWRSNMQIFGTALLTLSSSLLVTGFFLENYNWLRICELSAWGIITLGIGTGLHLIAGFRKSS